MSKLSLLSLSVFAIALSPASASPTYTDMPVVQQLEQRCDVEAMERLDASKVIAYTFENPTYTDTTIVAPGAVFRKHKEWYRLEYSCALEDDLRTVQSFEMKVGDVIPHEDWERYYLYP
ncbi:MAG: DUF930 domain-containing protein [Rhodobacteraceae bacterium]|nr:DUF930 domain-containing protein [Paracoccaceae bacterium]